MKTRNEKQYLETLVALERERERESLYSTWICLFKSQIIVLINKKEYNKSIKLFSNMLFLHTLKIN